MCINPSVLKPIQPDSGIVESVYVIASIGNEEIGNVSVSRETDDTRDTQSGTVRSIINALARRRVGDKPTGAYLQINTIRVLPSHRRQGVGSALLYEALIPFEDSSRARVRVSNDIAPYWFGNRGFYERSNEPVLESPGLFAVLSCIKYRQENSLYKRPDYDHRVER